MGGGNNIRRMRFLSFIITVFLSFGFATPAYALSFSINWDADFLADNDARNAFTRAADQWSAIFTDDITIEFDAVWQSYGVGSTTLGSAASDSYLQDFDTMRNAMEADGADESDDGITAYLPTAAQFAAPTLEAGDAISTVGIYMQEATLKALGYDTSAFPNPDSTLTFNSDYTWDYDNTDGVTALTMDFETVVAHEIGHALGFTSTVDIFDYNAAVTYAIKPLDFFRFGPGADPSTNAEFTTFPRDLTPGNAAFFDDISGTTYLFSTGKNDGDGQQASHWKDNLSIGLMDPTLDWATYYGISASDIRALDLIGFDYEVPTPLPATAPLFAFGLGALAWLKKRSQSRTKTI
ncbi:MAG: NF038122 family metalloprotease [Magnetococcales bacterium]|nr:NF038122 family metalloprotease [Magnetococcales bacterium]